MKLLKIALLVICLTLISTSVFAQSLTGRVSFYHEGTRTASGERYDKNGLTCAHRALPFGTKITVSYGARSVICRVNDRGPFIRGRVLDVSLGTARALMMTSAGVVTANLKW